MNDKIVQYLYHSILCPDDKEPMFSTSVCFQLFPPLYEYECPKCGKKIKVRK